MSSVDVAAHCAAHAVLCGRIPVTAPVGTVLAVPGRGDSPHAFDALADRLALDGYRTLAVCGDAAGGPATGSAVAGNAAASLPAAAADAAGAADTPVVLLGTDTGVLDVLSAVHTGLRPAGIVLVGMPGDAPRPGADEARVRLHDPARRAALGTEEQPRAGELLRDPVDATTVDALFDDAVPMPSLVLHGDSDRLCPFPLCSRRALRLRRARVVSVADTAHDVLRDTHRASAVAEIVLFIERLRSGPLRPQPVRTLLRSTW